MHVHQKSDHADPRRVISMQRIVETPDFSSALKEEVAAYNNALFVHSPSFIKRDAFGKISSIPHETFSDFEPNPDYESIVEGAEVFRAKNCDCLVSIGGGSSIDVAKGIKHILKNRDIVHIAIPTTSGTGCESTQFAVVYKEGVKQSLDSEELLPNVAILDGSLVLSVPDFQKRCTSLDAMCQCIESHWSMNSTEESREYSMAGLKMIISNHKSYLANDPDAGRNMMCGANLSGRAINITRTTAPHALSYAITKEYGIPHGCAVALTVIQFWDLLLSNLDETTHPAGKKFMEERLNELSCAFGGKGLSDGLNMADNVIAELLPSMNAHVGNAQTILSEINTDRLKNYPLNLNSKELERIVSQVIIQS